MDSPRSPRPWVLRPLQIGGLEGVLDVTAEGVTIGRSATNSAVIPEDGFPYVSSHHARVVLEGGVPVVEDLGSKNGTLVNGERVDRRRLGHGDIVQLGRKGPRFAVVRGGDASDTLATVVEPADAETVHGRDLSQSSLFRIKRGLGIPVHSDVDDLIRRRHRRTVRRSGLVALAIVVAGAVAFAVLSGQRDVEAARLREINQSLIAQLSTERDEQRRQQQAWNDERSRLENESSTLAARLQRLELGAGTSASELGRLREQLAETHQRLEAYNPLNVGAVGLEQVRRVTEAVVYVEVKQYFRHASGELLHAERAEDGRRSFNFEGRGEPVALESSGSGFAVTEQGWILTNAHVVDSGGGEPPLEEGPGPAIVPETSLAVVFSGTSQRHPARLVRSVQERGVDLGLLKIEPFPNMPHLDSLDLDLPAPAPMTEVYLCGFPLGRMAVQDGQVLIASTFKGILSRIVAPYFQIDASVHPGNSGGPVMDTRGRILGIATRVQRTPEGDYTPTIGYITPVQALASIWPPRTADGAPAASGK